ncbi:UNVERIFIED_CONTAM: Pollen receptor-like kinase [Sesamum latifolium]|uniref:Pollen receptor-like kinase n=1 Tax=Sesamum latifolium TaxID=2727402 RepID=A0AAW2T7Q2_9LAMI
MSTVTSAPSGPKLVFAADGYPTFELEDVVRASAEYLGKGTFGTSYVTSFGNGDTVMVK